MPPLALLVFSLAGLAGAAAILAAKRSSWQQWDTWLQGHPGFAFPIEAAGSVADKLRALGSGTTPNAIVEQGRVGRGLDLQRRTRCCTMAPGAARDRVCSESPCRTTPHWGADITAPTGTPVYAAKAGTIVGAGVVGDYGNLVQLAHADGAQSTAYAHLSRVDVRNGQTVPAGQQIGLVGNTGGAYGMSPHLHFEVHNHPRPNLARTATRLDPLVWLRENNINVARSASLELASAALPDKDAGTAGLDAAAQNPLLVLGAGAVAGALVAWLLKEKS